MPRNIFDDETIKYRLSADTASLTNCIEILIRDKGIRRKIPRSTSEAAGGARSLIKLS